MFAKTKSYSQHFSFLANHSLKSDSQQGVSTDGRNLRSELIVVDYSAALITAANAATKAALAAATAANEVAAAAKVAAEYLNKHQQSFSTSASSIESDSEK